MVDDSIIPPLLLLQWPSLLSTLFLLIHIPLMAKAADSDPCDYGNQKCGNISIPYPFGMLPNCGLPHYRISCTQNSPFLQLLSNDSISKEYQVLSFSTDYLIINATDLKASSCDLTSPNSTALSIADQAPFLISPKNVFAAVGCYSTGNFTTSGPHATGSCSNDCYNSNPFAFCNAYACCMVGLSQNGAKSIQLTGAGIAYELFPGVCGFSTVLEPNTYSTSEGSYGVFGAGQYGLRLSWGLPFSNKSDNCSTVKSTPGYACTSLSNCIGVGLGTDLPGYACECNLEGYRGDGYRNGSGCQNIDECKEGLHNCVTEHGICIDTPGSFQCNCTDNAQGDGIALSSNGTGCTLTDPEPDNAALIAGTSLSTAAAVAFLGLLVWWIYRVRRARVKKAQCFEMNGGIRLKEYMISATSRGKEAPRLFSEAELKKATQNFATDLELGHGGYGTVYKGTLPHSEHGEAGHSIVAIKKSNHNNKQEVDQFINEVIILSQINHRNIVQLLGCCLETPVPLLVYEYISNGTLSEHLHRKDGRFLSWEDRIAIALESAQALTYLHSSVSTPIFHRDIKSSNILLDKALTPKVSDFGISRLMPMDETHVSTLVQGTMGYLDPEYFQTFQLTDKSDVYSFGVVLLELITALKPIAMERGEEESNLSILCISRWKRGTFSTLIDPGLTECGDPRMMESMNEVAKLAISCLRVEGQKRPSMKEVFEELLWIRGSKEGRIHSSSSSSSHLLKHESNEDGNDIKVLLPSSRKLSDHSSFNLTGGSSSNSNGLQGLELMSMSSIMKRGR